MNITDDNISRSVNAAFLEVRHKEKREWQQIVPKVNTEIDGSRTTAVFDNYHKTKKTFPLLYVIVLQYLIAIVYYVLYGFFVSDLATSYRAVLAGSVAMVTTWAVVFNDRYDGSFTVVRQGA